MIILHTLGTASIETEGSTTIAPNAPRRLALLLYLAVERGREFSIERLASLVFPEEAGSEAGHSVRQSVYKLRRAGVPVLNAVGGYMIGAKEVLADYEAALRASTIDDDTMRRMTGGFLPTFVPPDSEAYTAWLDALRGTQVSALVRRILPQMEKAMQGARWESAELAARAAIGLDPLNERANFALAELLSVGGSKMAAVQLLDAYILQVAPHSEDLAKRAASVRRRIADGLGTSNRDAAGTDSLSVVPPRLVGRETELAALREAFDRARSGDPQCIVVAGEAGIGKTRLVSELSAATTVRRAHVGRVVIQPHDGDRPMGAFVDLVPALLDLPGALGSSPSTMAALSNLTGRRIGDDAPPRVAAAEEHEQRWSAVSRAVVDLCEAIAVEQTLVLVIEDAHWLDALSANTIGRIVGTRRKARILVIATTRDPRPLVREIRLTERCQTLSLLPLVPDAAGELLDLVLPPAPPKPRRNRVAEHQPSIKTRIAAISAGNPLFLISLAAHSRAHRGPFEVPGTIVETFAQRIDGLSRCAMSVLATCAELGKHSTMRRLVRSLEMRKHQLVESMLELTSVGLVLRDGQNAIPAHPLVSEALRSRLPHPARRAVAYAVAATLERDAEAGASPSLWWDAAESWRVADNPERAIHALKQCAQHALEIGRPGEAARMLEHAVALPQSTEQLIELSTALIRAASAANEFPLVLRGAERLRSAAVNQKHDEIEMAELRAFLGQTHYDPAAAERLLPCIRAADATATHRVEAAITLLKCVDMSGRDDLRQIAIGETAGSDLASVNTVTRLEFEILVASTQGDRRSAASFGRTLIRHFREPEHHASTPLRYYVSGVCALQLGGFDSEAAAEYERLAELAERRGAQRSRLYAAVQLASLHFDAAREQEADEWIKSAVAITQEWPELAEDFSLATTRMEIDIFRGQLESAKRLIARLATTIPQASDLRRRWLDAGLMAIKSRCGQLRQDARGALHRIGRDRLNSISGIRDFEVAIAVESLLQLGLAQDASAILREYLVSERHIDRRPTRLLSRAIESTPGSEALFPSGPDAHVSPATENSEGRPHFLADSGCRPADRREPGDEFSGDMSGAREAHHARATRMVGRAEG